MQSLRHSSDNSMSSIRETAWAPRIVLDHHRKSGDGSQVLSRDSFGPAPCGNHGNRGPPVRTGVFYHNSRRYQKTGICGRSIVVGQTGIRFVASPRIVEVETDQIHIVGPLPPCDTGFQNLARIGIHLSIEVVGPRQEQGLTSLRRSNSVRAVAVMGKNQMSDLQKKFCRKGIHLARRTRRPSDPREPDAPPSDPHRCSR